MMRLILSVIKINFIIKIIKVMYREQFTSFYNKFNDDSSTVSTCINITYV